MGESAEGSTFRTQTQDFRQTLAEARQVRAQLDALPPGDDQRKPLETRLQALDGTLQRTTGYTSATAPKPGTLWMDPRLQRGAQPSATRFPAGTPVTRPPRPEDALFAGGRTLALRGPDGKERTFKNADEYRKFVADTRAARGMPRKDGDLQGVHLTMMGGGGQGKRYLAAMNEMLELGVVPTSVSGTSAGSIGAALIAAGADPKRVAQFMTDPRLQQNMNNANAYQTLDSVLRDITGIKDRPVTFADLKMPLQIAATTFSDTQPPAGRDDLTQAANRRFIFSQETTPNTPVALAVRASMAIPLVYDPVRMVDPTTGREMHLYDGGILDNLPTDTAPAGQPVVGLSLWDQGTLAPTGDNVARPAPLPAGNIETTTWGSGLRNANTAMDMVRQSARRADDYRDVTQPRPGQFHLGLPTWNLEDPRQRNTVLGFDWDPKVDPELDKQTTAVTRDFFRRFLGDIGDPRKAGTNTSTAAPADRSFERKVAVNGNEYTARYDGKNSLVFSRAGERHLIRFTPAQAERMLLDHQTFGDMPGQLRHLLREHLAELEQMKKAS
ncbi:MAG TPA: patatin-like phospholipase family protein [Myxococcales bacterium]|nr:patatin-like phospholipase family protein [Myxococcales bacterium]